MGQELYATQPVFREVLDRCAELLGGQLERPLLEALFERDALLADTRYAQPALFAVELALARLWQSWGIEPDVVVGHSVGEYAAACVAGVFELEQGLRLIAERGVRMGQVSARGAMGAVFADAEQVADATRGHAELSVAAYNGAHTVVSGAAEAVEQLLAEFRARGIRCERLNTSQAFHSALIEPALEPLEALAGSAGVSPSATYAHQQPDRPAAGERPSAGRGVLAPAGARAGAICPQPAEPGGPRCGNVVGDRSAAGVAGDGGGELAGWVAASAVHTIAAS